MSGAYVVIWLLVVGVEFVAIAKFVGWAFDRRNRR